ncbi:hypothetical protein MNBD_BACTEROID05-415 [hydrothermal vent metagenome]|uniref:Histidine kinase domain-containing protein n=1 Tax=hydrothermal vent metagenome TaxID=652676 RepID=A0A3B0U5G9_9ZZZZ
MTKSALSSLSQAELFQKVGEICACVNVVVSEGELLEISLDRILELFDASRGSIFILDESKNELVLKYAKGLKDDEQRRLVKKMGEGVVGQVAEIKQPMIVSDISNDGRFKKYKARSEYKTASFICAPLLIKDKLIGVINITDKGSGTHFEEHELQLLDLLTSQIALNYHRIQLYQKFKSIVKESKNLKSQLGQTNKETKNLKKQVIIHEKLATIGKLAGGIAHEFNNPLDGVMRYTNLSIEHIKDDEVVRGYLLEIKYGLNRMAKIVKNLLACSRNDFPSKEKVDFKKTLDHTIIGIQSEIIAKNIVLKKDVPSGIPEIPDLGLERVISNLLHNAVDAIDDGGEISVSVSASDQNLKINIKDTGSGIAQSRVKEIFEPFYTTKDMEKGCGLGLTIVGEIIKCYEGKIDVSSQVGKGTTFTISIPI